MKTMRIILKCGKEFKISVPEEEVDELTNAIYSGATVMMGTTKMWIRHGSVDVLLIGDEPESSEEETIKEEKPKSKKK